MRELVLNHASLTASSRPDAVKALKDVISGMEALVQCGAARLVLRSARDTTETPCAPGFSLFEALMELRRTGAREEFAFFAGPATKLRLLSDLEMKHRFFGCETRDIPPEDGAPLLFCALDDHVAVSFPTHPDWERDRITVRFDELLPDGAFSAESEEIDHLSRPGHAEAICLRYRESRHTDFRSGEELWLRRGELFPNLTFGLDVEDHVADISHILRTVVNRLCELDTAAARWNDGPAPPWTCKVTNESGRLRDNPKLKEARRFRSRSGAHEFFFWHARFGSGRIHLRFDAATREVEIGYIGPHLPL